MELDGLVGGLMALWGCAALLVVVGVSRPLGVRADFGVVAPDSVDLRD